MRSNPMFEKRHYEALADTLKERKWKKALIDMLEEDNPRFDKEKFLLRSKPPKVYQGAYKYLEEEIIYLFKEGKTMSEIRLTLLDKAEKVNEYWPWSNFSTSTIHYILKINGLTREAKPRKTLAERNQEIFKMRLKGRKYKEIAEKHKISTSRVGQIYLSELEKQSFTPSTSLEETRQ